MVCTIVKLIKKKSINYAMRNILDQQRVSRIIYITCRVHRCKKHYFIRSILRQAAEFDINQTSKLTRPTYVVDALSTIALPHGRIATMWVCVSRHMYNLIKQQCFFCMLLSSVAYEITMVSFPLICASAVIYPNVACRHATNSRITIG